MASRGFASQLKVGIVGGSITGCALAIELIRRGCDVVLWERSGEELKDRGAGIGMPPSVLATLREHDLIDADFPYFPAREFLRKWRTPHAGRNGYLAWAQPTALALLNWGALYRDLRKRVPDAVYRTGQRVIALRNSPDGPAAADLAGGATIARDLVICADGYASLGRRTLFPSAAIAYAGYVLWRGFLDEAALAGETGPLESGVRCIGFPSGHGIFYFVPGADGSIARGRRLINWGIYVTIPNLTEFMTGRDGRVHDGSLPPGAMPPATERALKAQARERLPDYYADIVDHSPDTFAYAIYDSVVPAYRIDRIALAGDAGAFARPHTAAGALKGIKDAVLLAEALDAHSSLDAALESWSNARTADNAATVAYGQQLGRALVTAIPDWSQMDAAAMERWFNSAVPTPTEFLPRRDPASKPA